MKNYFESPFKEQLLIDQITNPVSKWGDADIALLLEMAWWDWELQHLEKAMPLLCSEDIVALHDYWKAEISL